MGPHAYNTYQVLEQNASASRACSIHPLIDRLTDLAAVGVGAGVGHGQDSGLGVPQLEVLVGELLAVDRLTACVHTSHNKQDKTSVEDCTPDPGTNHFNLD